VHKHLCAATAAAIKVRLKMGRADMAEQLKTTGVQSFGCDEKDLMAAGERR
jgi:hypothetical protein